jgi:hypothetical protein
VEQVCCAQLDAQLREDAVISVGLGPSSVFAKLHQASTNALPRSSSRKWLLLDPQVDQLTGHLVDGRVPVSKAAAPPGNHRTSGV